MSKQNRLYNDLAAGLEDGIAWARGEKALPVTQIEASEPRTSPPVRMLPSLDSLYSPLHISYNQDVDALSIHFSQADVEESYETEPGVIREYDGNGNLIRLEVRNFSSRVGLPIK
jgi:hypothetical protein